MTPPRTIIKVGNAAAAMLLAVSLAAAEPAPLPPPTPPGWSRHAAPGAIAGAGTYTVALPPGTVGGPSQGVDSYVADYRTHGLTLVFDFGAFGSPDEFSCRAELSCVAGPMLVGGVQASRVSYRRRAPEARSMHFTYYIPFAATVSAARPNGISLTVRAECATIKACALADRVVRTIAIVPED